jgi:hypothetical protein
MNGIADKAVIEPGSEQKSSIEKSVSNTADHADHPGPSDFRAPSWEPKWLKEMPGYVVGNPAETTPGVGAQAAENPVDLPLPTSAPATPPRGTRLYFYDEKGWPCSPENARGWTWAHGPQWFLTTERPVPAYEMTLAETAKQRCRQCVQRKLRLTWRTTANGSRQLRCECEICGGCVAAAVKRPPGNLDVEFRAATSSSTH